MRQNYNFALLNLKMAHPYPHSINYFSDSYNQFFNQASMYEHYYSYSMASSLRNLLQLWKHARGMDCLVHRLTQEYQKGLLPLVKSGLGQTKEEDKKEPEVKIEEIEEPHIVFKTPQRPNNRSERDSSKKRQTASTAAQVKQEQIYYQEEEQDNKIYSDFSSSEVKSYKRGPYKSYTTAEKLVAVELFKQDVPITDISKKLKIPCKNIKRWASEGVLRKKGGGRRRTNPNLEEQVASWLLQRYSSGQVINIEQIQQYALSRSRDPHFKASRGWALNFVDRFGLKDKYSIN